ncbi:MAG TPA: hypothetical protein P5032_06175 [Candidatus Competibacter sp.]|nr:hypothetical protein [Candidatus Competibacter sp.]
MKNSSITIFHWSEITMIPEAQAIQENLALGLITEREAEELCFLVELVDRDYRQSASESRLVNLKMAEPKTETDVKDGNYS